MDRRSWLWKRRSSEKNSGETESSGGSGTISLPVEKLSDEQQAYPNETSQSSEVTMKGVLQDGDANDALKILTEKLSDALANITAKEESVKQQAKVAEEAVAGWEKAEKEAITLKQQLDVATKKNSTLEDRIAHLDEALKECLRQLRQVREEQDRKIQEATKKPHDSESNKSELAAQLADLRAQLEKANAKIEATASLESDLRLRLGVAEKENASLQLELHSRLQELEIRTLERDLSTKTAETASKQNLESIKRVAKLDGECRRLKTMLRKATMYTNHKSFSASPSHVDSLTDSFSDSGERSTDCGQSHSDTWASTLTVELDGFKHEKGNSKISIPPSPEIGLMDDFLEMERLAAFPVRDKRSGSLASVTSTDKQTIDSETSLKAELEAMAIRTAELEEKVEMFEREKVELGLALAQSQNQLKISQAQFRDVNRKMGMLQAELDLANELRQAIEMELEDANVRREEAESQVRDIDNECKLLLSRVTFLEGKAQKERSLYSEVSGKCGALEDELSRLKHEVETLQSQLTSTNAKKEVAESRLETIEAELKSLLAKVSSLEDEVGKERRVSKEFTTQCREIDCELSRTKSEAESLKNQLALANELKEIAEKELEMTNSKREEFDLQLKVIEVETKSLLAKVSSLEQEVEKERKLSSEFAAKCKTLEENLSKMKHGSVLRLAPFTKEDLTIQQEKELAVAASKLAECQNTISSLGNQLKSLAMLEDIFLESDKLPDISEKDSQILGNAVEVTGG